MTASLLWFMKKDAKIAFQFGELLLSDAALGVRNTHELAMAEWELQTTSVIFSSDDVPLPDGFPAPVLALPHAAFAPDFLAFGGYDFVSRRFRQCLAQPPHVIQYTPVQLVAGGPEARAQDYRLLRILAVQPAMDLERSECALEEFTHRLTGARLKRPQWIDRFVLQDGFRPRTEIFRVAESATRVLVVDAMAERVLRAGCTGVAFADLDNRWSGQRVDRYRTADGFTERRVGFLD